MHAEAAVVTLTDVHVIGGGTKQRRKRTLPPPELLEADMFETDGKVAAGRKSAPSDDCVARSPPPQRRRSTGACI